MLLDVAQNEGGERQGYNHSYNAQKFAPDGEREQYDRGVQFHAATHNLRHKNKVLNSLDDEGDCKGRRQYHPEIVSGVCCLYQCQQCHWQQRHKLQVGHEVEHAYEKAEAIDQYNKDRKELDKQITEEANAILEARGEMNSDKKSIVIYNKDWHKGIIGIVASRLTELYYKPAVVLTLTNGLATGSSRSVQGFDVYRAIDSARDLLENFGGHTYAVGLSLKEENIPEFAKRFEEYVANNIQPNQLRPQLDIDTYLSFADITPEFISTLKKFNPFGPWNNKPVFCTKGVYDYGTSKLVGKQLEHIKLELVDNTSGKVINGIAFNMADQFEHIHSGNPFDICYTIEENKHHNATSSLQLFVKEIRVSKQ